MTIFILIVSVLIGCQLGLPSLMNAAGYTALSFVVMFACYDIGKNKAK